MFRFEVDVCCLATSRSKKPVSFTLAFPHPSGIVLEANLQAAAGAGVPGAQKTPKITWVGVPDAFSE